jgi:hypothetical protein
MDVNEWNLFSPFHALPKGGTSNEQALFDEVARIPGRLLRRFLSLHYF